MRKLSKFFIKTLVKYVALHSKTRPPEWQSRAGNKVSSVYPPGKPFGREVN
jgi:hypothetical protein